MIHPGFHPFHFHPRFQGLGKPKSFPHRNKGPEGAARQAEQQRKATERKKEKARHAREHEKLENEVTKLIREGMDPADAQDMVDARLPKDPVSGSDGDEEEEGLETLGGGNSSPHTSPCWPSESGVPKRARDEAEMDPR